MYIYKWLKKKILLHHLKQNAKMYWDILGYFCAYQAQDLSKDYSKPIHDFHFKHSIYQKAIRRLKSL